MQLTGKNCASAHIHIMRNRCHKPLSRFLRPNRGIPASGVALIAVVALAARGGTPEGVVVQVGQTAITKTTVDHWMSVMAGGRAVPDPSRQQDQSLRQQALSFLVFSQWLLGEATEEGLKVSERGIEQRFKEKESASSPGGGTEFHEFLKATGKTISDVMFEVKTELASSRIRQTVASKEPKITRAQIAKYYNQNKQRYAHPERRELVITNRKSKTEVDKLKREIESGKSLASVTKLESVERPATVSSTDKGDALERAVLLSQAKSARWPRKAARRLLPVRGKTSHSEQ